MPGYVPPLARACPFASFFVRPFQGLRCWWQKWAASAVGAFERDPSGPVLLLRHVALDRNLRVYRKSPSPLRVPYVFARPAHFCSFVSLTVRTFTLLA